MNKTLRSTMLGGLTGLCALLLMAGLAQAAPTAQEVTPTPSATPIPQACNECHLDIASAWSASPHAHAFADPVFQDRWQGHGQPGDCLLCHTTGYQASTGQYVAEGVTCESCHGAATADHPPAVIPIKADTDYCGSCHAPTLSEWRLSGHSTANVGCMGCHAPHSQKSLFAVADDMCMNCHKDDMGDYLEDLHIQKGIGCVDCHALVIPPETLPEDGLVPTGHTFTVHAATCVACHTDALHAGFSLPGYENGAQAAHPGETSAESTPSTPPPQTTDSPVAEQRVQVLEAALASRSRSVLFQGGLIGLALGGSTVWLIAHNARRNHVEGEADEVKE